MPAARCWKRSAPLIDMAALTRSEMQSYANRPRGRLRVSAPYGLERTAFPDILSDYMRGHPDVHISLRVTNARVDLVADGCDLAFRLGRVQDDNLIVSRLVQVDWVLCATPGYWARAGMPRHPDDVRDHDVLSLWSGGGTARVPFEIGGRAHDVPVRSRMESNEPSALIGIALNGLGAVAVPAVMASPHLGRGALVPVLEKFMPRDIWFHAAYSQRRHNSAALRSLLGHMESRVGRQRSGLRVEGITESRLAVRRSRPDRRNCSARTKSGELRPGQKSLGVGVELHHALSLPDGCSCQPSVGDVVGSKPPVDAQRAHFRPLQTTSGCSTPGRSAMNG